MYTVDTGGGADIGGAPTEALREREERFRGVFVQAALPQALAAVEDLRLVAANRLYCELLGYDEADLFTKTVVDITHPDDRGSAQALFENCLAGGPSHVVSERRYVRKDGEVVDVRIHSSLVRDDQGRPRYVHGLVQDLTEQREAERRLYASEARFRFMVEQSCQVLLLLEADGTVRYASPNARRLLGVDRDRGWALFDVVPPDHAATLRDALTSVALGRESEVELTLRTQHADVVRHWEVRLRDHLREAPLHAILLAMQDVTERVVANELAEGEAQILRLLLGEAPRDRVLESLAGLVEAHVPGVRCTVLRLEGNVLHHGAAPSMPREFVELVDGLLIGPAAGSCGTAAYRRSPVVVEDVRSDPLWHDYQHLAAAAGIRSCWSLPIRGADGSVLGTFALYGLDPRTPAEHEWELCQRLSGLAGLVLAHRHSQPPASPSPSDAARRIQERLSPRERDVLRQIALGLTNTEIAERLRIGVRTVESHRANIARKLNGHSRSALVRAALDGGLLHAELTA